MKHIKYLVLTVRILLGLAAPTAVFGADDVETNLSTEATNVPAMSQGQAVTPSVEAAAGRTQVSQSAAAASAEPAPQTTPADPAAEFPADKGLRMTFKDVQLSAVLDYMSKAAGFTIKPKPGLSINGKVTVWNDSPLTKEEAVDLLKQVLNDNGYTVIQDGKILTIISTFEAKKSEIPVKRFRTVDEIPRNTDVATYVIPVHTLNPIALVRNLQPLTSSETDLQANESANSLLMTDTQINIRRVAEIVTTLDSVSSSVNSIKVYRLNYADSKTLAGLVKELFPSSDTRSSSSGGNGGNFARFGGGGGGRGGGGAVGFPGFGGATDTGGGGSSGQTPTSRVSAVSDDTGNALVVSAPEDLVSTIDQLVDKLDQPVEDVTVVKLFHLTNADPGETVDLLANLFPDEDNSSTANRTPFQFGGFGPQGINQAAAAGSSSGPSERTKKAGKVVAVADKRTQSVLVTTSRNLMPQIEEMITELDANPANKLNVHVLSLKNANPQAVMQIVQDLFASSSSTSSTSSSQNDPLATRSQTLLNNMMSSGAGSGSGGLSLGSTSSGSGSTSR